MNLSGKSILLTGASSGIGYHMAIALAKENCRIALLARSMDKLKEIAETAGTSDNIILPIQCDVSKKEEVNAAVGKVLEEFGSLDILILNAGTSYRLDAEDFSAEKGEEIIKVNLTSKFYFLEKLIPHFISKKSGMIVGVSSLADTRGFPRSGFYNASKAGFSKAARKSAHRTQRTQHQGNHRPTRLCTNPDDRQERIQYAPPYGAGESGADNNRRHKERKEDHPVPPPHRTGHEADRDYTRHPLRIPLPQAPRSPEEKRLVKFY